MNRQGFTLIELAVVLVLAGLVTSAGLILLPKLWHEKQRLETQKYLLAAKAALLTAATDYNALPPHEDADKILLPTTILKLKKKDAFDQPLRYIVNNKLLLDTTPGADKTLPCSTLKDYFVNGIMAGFPLLWQHGMPEEAGQSLPVAALLISRGADRVLGRRWVDADGDGLVDGGETFIGDNNTTNDLANDFVQAPPSEAFDDLVVPLTIPELMNALPECRQ